MKTKEQITKEIEALKTVRPNVCPMSMFGDDNLAALDAQIYVLDNDMHNETFYDRYDCISSSEYILESALDARQWIDDKEDPDTEGLACDWPLKKNPE